MVHSIDLLYWIIATILVYRVLYIVNSGEVRVYIFLGLMLGISIYFALLSIWTVRSVHMIIRVIDTLINWGIRVVNVLIVRPIRLLYRGIVILLGFLVAVSIFLYKIMLQLFYPFWKILSWLTKPLHRYARPIVRWAAKSKAGIEWIKRKLRRTR